jgi:hypothetical protein
MSANDKVLCDNKDKRRKVVSPKNIVIYNAPSVNSLKDLIELSKSVKIYNNINTLMLWKITPFLEELDNMIGMKELKDTILYQILYYLQNMHNRNNEEYLHTIIMGPPGHGKCLKKDTPIIMYDGSVKMVQDITQGEKLMGDDSTARTVLSICRGQEKMYKIEQEYGDDYTVNESHILSLKLTADPRITDLTYKESYCVSWFSKERVNYKYYNYANKNKQEVHNVVQQFCRFLPKTGTVIDIELLEYLKRPRSWKMSYKGYKTGVDFSPVEVELDPYVLGIWLSTGMINTPCIIQENHVIIEYLKDHFDDLIVITEKDNDKNVHIFINPEQDVNTNRFIQPLKKYGIFSNKFIPEVYKINSIHVRLLVLAGIIDGEGVLINSSQYSSVIEVINQDKKYIEDIDYIARSLGIVSNITEFTRKFEKEPNSKYYKASLSGNIDMIPLLVESKKPHVNNNPRSLTYGIKVVEEEVGTYYGFEIDGNHRFLLGDFTVTHNTEAAKIIGKLYQTMGILSPTGQFKIAYRDDLVAEYVGQTAIKTRKLLESCIGGILFIDEVYSLGSGNKEKDTFSKEAIDTLTGFLSEHKNNFCCIAAGYEEDIRRCFFDSNKGLERRFPWVHRINNYTDEELADITLKMIEHMKWEISLEKNDIVEVIKNNKEFFKYAGGDLETFLSKAKMTHAKRVFSLNQTEKFKFTKEDLENAILMIKTSKKKSEVEDDGYINKYMMYN